jgi:hypothetical protein
MTRGISYDAFITMLNANGSGLVYSTYLGGSGDDNGREIALDGSGNVYVVGLTKSADFDVTSEAFQTTYGGGDYDVFVTKLYPGGNTSVEEPSTKKSWHIFPNPTTTGCFILQTEQGGVFELIDISGKVIQTYNVFNTTEQIQVDLPCGVYFIRERKSGYTQKLVIE